MSYVKYREDDIEIFENRNRSLLDSITKTNHKQCKEYKCHYCDEIYYSIENRNTHIKSKHNIIGPLIFVNGRICKGELYVKRIESIFIDLCGFYDSKIFFDNLEITPTKGKEVIDLIRMLRVQEKHSIKIDSVSLEIFVYPSMNVKSKKIDEFIDNWEHKVSIGEMIERNYPNDLNSAEKRFLDGFYNYYLVFLSKSDKQKRYEDAYSILSEFDNKTAKSLSVLRIIAFRLNWIERLEEITFGDNIFKIVLDFFKNQESDIQFHDNEDGQLLIENELDRLLSFIFAYQEKDYDFVRINLNEITEYEDLNQNDKLLLLKARLALIDSNIDLSRSYYESIISPYFEDEKSKLLSNINGGKNQK